MRFGKGLGEDAVSNLFENVSLTLRVRKGARDCQYSPTPASADPRPLVWAAAQWSLQGGHPAPVLIRTGLQGRSCGYLSGPGSPAPES